MDDKKDLLKPEETKLADKAFDQEWPDDEEISTINRLESEWDAIQTAKEDGIEAQLQGKIRKAHENLELHEELVECQECFDLFPKSECFKADYGYLCPKCHELHVLVVPAELVDDAAFDLDFDDPEEFEEEETPIEIEAPVVTEPEVATIEEPVSGIEDASIETPVAFADVPAVISDSSDDSSDEKALGDKDVNVFLDKEEVNESLKEEAANVDHYELHFENPEDEKTFGGLDQFKTKDEAYAKSIEYLDAGHPCAIKKLICSGDICSLVDLDEPNKVNEKLEERAMTDTPFDSEVKVGDKIRIGHLEGEDNSYDGKEGTVDHIDSLGQLHGTWGGLAVIPGVDEFEIITEDLNESRKSSVKYQQVRAYLTNTDFDHGNYDICEEDDDGSYFDDLVKANNYYAVVLGKFSCQYGGADYDYDEEHDDHFTPVKVWPSTLDTAHLNESLKEEKSPKIIVKTEHWSNEYDTVEDAIKDIENSYVNCADDEIAEKVFYALLSDLKDDEEAYEVDENGNHVYTRIYENLTENKLTETSIAAISDTWTIAESSILEYYPNKHQVEAYINKAKAVELAEAAKGNTVQVIIYEKFERELREWPYYEDVSSPVKICYDSIENPEVVKILVQNKLMTENLEEAKNIVGREKVSSWSTDTAEGYEIKIERHDVNLGGVVYTVDQYKKEIEDKNNQYKSNFNIEPDPYKKAALADKRPLADRLDELLASGEQDMEIAVVAGSVIGDMMDYLEARGIKFIHRHAKGGVEIFRLEDGRTITLHLVFIENLKEANYSATATHTEEVGLGTFEAEDEDDAQEKAEMLYNDGTFDSYWDTTDFEVEKVDENLKEAYYSATAFHNEEIGLGVIEANDEDEAQEKAEEIYNDGAFDSYWDTTDIKLAKIDESLNEKAEPSLVMGPPAEPDVPASPEIAKVISELNMGAGIELNSWLSIWAPKEFYGDENHSCNVEIIELPTGEYKVILSGLLVTDDEISTIFPKEVKAEEIIKYVEDNASKVWHANKLHENLDEASSAETRAFKNGGQDANDLIQGKAIARIKDPKARDAAIAAVKAGRPEIAKDFYGQRKEDQADAAFTKKMKVMDKAGVTGESLEFTIPQDFASAEYPEKHWSELEYDEPVDIIDTARGEEIASREINEDADVDYVEYMHSYCNALEPHMDELRKIEDVEELKKAILDIVNEDPDVNTTEKKNKFVWLIKNKKWSSTKNIMAYLDKAMEKAKGIEVKVDDQGELVKEELDPKETQFVFTPEEQLEYHCDEEGNCEDSYDQLCHCGWCDEVFTKSEMRHEADFGWICSRCEAELKSHGGPLTFIENESLKEDSAPKEQKLVIIDWSSKTLAYDDAKYEELKARAKREYPDAIILFYHPLTLEAAYKLVKGKPQNFVIYTDHEILLDSYGKQLNFLPNCEKIIRLDKEARAAAMTKEGLVEAKEEEEIPTDFAGIMDYLSKDEEEAIEGYDKVLDNVEDEKVKDNLEHIRDEEVAHKEYLDAAKEDPTVDYEHEDDSEE